MQIENILIPNLCQRHEQNQSPREEVFNLLTSDVSLGWLSLVLEFL